MSALPEREPQAVYDAASRPLGPVAASRSERARTTATRKHATQHHVGECDPLREQRRLDREVRWQAEEDERIRWELDGPTDLYSDFGREW